MKIYFTIDGDLIKTSGRKFTLRFESEQENDFS